MYACLTDGSRDRQSERHAGAVYTELDIKDYMIPGITVYISWLSIS